MYAAHRAHSLVWLTDAARRLGQELWGELPGHIVGMAIDGDEREPAQLAEPYMLYCGRIDPNKGCNVLFDYFMRFKKENPSQLRLVLTDRKSVRVGREW